jgi:hypothetical protein
VQTYCTLSPVPGFRRWADKEIAAAAAAAMAAAGGAAEGAGSGANAEAFRALQQACQSWETEVLHMPEGEGAAAQGGGAGGREEDRGGEEGGGGELGALLGRVVASMAERDRAVPLGRMHSSAGSFAAAGGNLSNDPAAATAAASSSASSPGGGGGGGEKEPEQYDGVTPVASHSSRWGAAGEDDGGTQLDRHGDGTAGWAVERALEAVAVRYLLTRRGGGGGFGAGAAAGPAIDPVANFHLQNGACVESVRVRGDCSRKGVAESYTVMVNYRCGIHVSHACMQCIQCIRVHVA